MYVHKLSTIFSRAVNLVRPLNINSVIISAFANFQQATKFSKALISESRNAKKETRPLILYVWYPKLPIRWWALKHYNWAQGAHFRMVNFYKIICALPISLTIQTVKPGEALNIWKSKAIKESPRYVILSVPTPPPDILFAHMLLRKISHILSAHDG